MSRAFFETVADALIGFLPRERRAFSHVAGGRNLKVWYDDTAEHYEVQLISRAVLRAATIDAKSSGLEIGFHVEHADAERTRATLDRLRAAERSWRTTLGPEAVVGPFIGRQRSWGRLSEVWLDEPTDEAAAVEAADRLATYIEAVEPIRTATTSRRKR